MLNMVTITTNFNERTSILKISIALFLGVLAYMAYVVPALVLMFNGAEYFISGWDQETYLSYQGTLGIKDKPGFSLLYIVYFLQKINISGATQHIILTFFFVPLMAWMLVRILCFYKVDTAHAICYTIIIMFASILFNYSNPLIFKWFPKDSFTPMIVHGYETYPSILRVPTPLLSYFMIVCGLFAYTKHRKKFILLLPLFFLHFAVFVGYCYSLMFFFLYKKTTLKNDLAKIFFASLVSYIILSFFIFLNYHFLLSVGTKQEIAINSFNFIYIRKLFLPVVSLISFFFLICLMLFTNLKNSNSSKYLLMVVLASFCISNTNWLTGFSISEVKTIQDYSNSVFGGLAIVFFLRGLSDQFSEKYKNIVVMLSTALLVLFLFNIKGFSFKTLQFRLFSGFLLQNQADLEKIQADPMHAIVLHRGFAGQIAFRTALAIHPITSYGYNFGFISNQCVDFLKSAQQALAFLTSNDFSHKSKREQRWITQAIETLNGNVFMIKRNQEFKYQKDQAYCASLFKEGKYFFIAPGKHSYIYFPQWKNSA